jgi:hypothetical protein
MSITRRALMKGISILPLAASGMSLLSCEKGASNGPALQAVPATTTDKTPRVNVILHGMFAMIFDYSQTLTGGSMPLLLMAPKVDMHAYGAGTWKKETQLVQGAKCVLQGVTCNTKFDINGYSTNPLINMKGALPTGTAPYCSFQLPFPDDIVPLRVLKRGGGSSFFSPGATSYAKQVDNATELPMAYALMYEKFSGSGIQLFDVVNNDTLWQADGSPVQRLHIFADPVFDDIPSGHMQDALDQMNGMFMPDLGIKFDPNNTLLKNPVPIDNSTGHSSIDHCEESTLAEERQGLCTPGWKGGSPRNCMKLLLTIPPS